MPKCVFKIVLFFVLMGIVPFSQAQQAEIDSLKREIAKTKDDKLLSRNYLLLANVYSLIDADSSLHYAHLALDAVKKAPNRRIEGIALFLLSYNYDQTGQWDDAVVNLKKAIDIFKEVQDTSMLVASYINLGVIYSYGKNQTDAVDCMIEAYKYSKLFGESDSISEIHTNIGSFYEYIKEYRTARRYYLDALEIDKKKGGIDNQCMTYVSLAYVDIKLGELERAFEYLQNALKLLPQLKDEHRETEIQAIVSLYYLENGNVSEAEKTINWLDSTIQSQRFTRLEAELLYQKGKLEMLKMHYSKALEYFDAAIEKSRELDKYDLLPEIYTEKTHVYVRLKQFEKAFEMQQMATRAYENLKPREIARKLALFEQQKALQQERSRFLLEQQLNAEKLRNEQMRSKTRLQLAAFASVLLVVIVIVLALYYYSEKRHTAALRGNFEIINRQKILLEENYNRLAEDEQKLKTLNATKDKFFSIIAHDLKNPFNVLIGISDLLRSDEDIKNNHEEFSDLVEGMFQTATSGYELLENLLEWSRTQTGTIAFEPNEFDIKQVFDANKELYKGAAKNKNLSVEISSGSYRVSADYEMINFIVRNLLNNAIKFSYPNGNIMISSESKDGKLVVAVKDEGIGMDEELLQKLFKIEHNVQKNGTANEKGTGLGLILCKEFIEKNKGEIWVESELGKGSTFFFSLPLA